MKQQISVSELMKQSGVAFGTSGARGLVSTMTDRVCYGYAMGFLRHLMVQKNWQSGGVVALAGDLRPSTPRILAACAAAVRVLGGTPEFCGFVPTPALACHTAPILETTEHDLDAFASFVLALVVLDWKRAGFPAWNAGFDAFLLQCIPEPVGVIPPVRQHPLCLGQLIQQSCGAGIITDLAGGDEESQGAAIGIGYRVKLGVHPTLRASDQASEIPFFTRRLEAVRCALK